MFSNPTGTAGGGREGKMDNKRDKRKSILIEASIHEFMEGKFGEMYVIIYVIN